ncbi:helix-turn-helix domain-containing protein [Nitrospina sp. 32_T5]|uniref:helix-turn-helix domain-containing protein n=1 Tax=unclassified Nitrospina TaxID=2638683 RepID=UPI003F9514DA
MGFTDAFNRIRLETDLQTQEELARFLGIRQSSVSGAKKRGRFPNTWAEKLSRHYNLRYEWIMEGHEPKRLVPGMTPAEIQQLMDRFWWVLLHASDAGRTRLKEVLESVYREARESR